MQAFAQLFEALDQTNKTQDKVALLRAYFQTATDEDRLWVLALFMDRRPKRQLGLPLLRQWAAEAAGIPDWMFEESYSLVGDLAETIALLLPPPSRHDDRSLSDWVRFVRQLDTKDLAHTRAALTEAWDGLSTTERFLLIKLLTGGFRIGISEGLIVRALAEAFDIEKDVLTHRLMGEWHPDHTTFGELLFGQNSMAELSRPYPFCLAHPLEDLSALGHANDWYAEWKWDGIRGQLIHRQGTVSLWSRGEELLTARFPELAAAGAALPSGTVIDGEILGFRDGQLLPFGDLQTRITRKNLTSKQLADTPAIFMAYDLLEMQAQDIRQTPFETRRTWLQTLCQAAIPGLRLSPLLRAEDWETFARYRADSRTQQAEGLMLKHRLSTYQTGRKQGVWWKWKVEPLSIDAVLLYAQRGHGRRAGLYSDYTFGVWDGDRLVTFAKAYSGLTDAELAEVNAFIQQNTLEKFGPVRTVRPELVFEIGFEGIQASGRHKSGVALRFPRILRWRRDKTAAQASTLAELQALLYVK